MILLGRVVFPTRMKIASSTASFDRDLRAGDLTQLEWLDLCVEPLGIDGVVFDVRHFPRTDDEYLAQLKKMCVDRGLSVAGLAADALFESDDLRWIEIALHLGAPLLIARTPQATDAAEAGAWNGVVAAARKAASAAKRSNVTLAIRNAPGTFCEDASALKRLAKDVDSAWIRYAPDPARLLPLESAETLASRAVIVTHDIGERIPHGLRVFRGFLVLDDASGQASAADAGGLISGFRAVLEVLETEEVAAVP